MKLKVVIAAFLLTMLLTLESGCIDSSNGPINETRPEESIDDQESSFNDIVETAPEKTFSVKNNT
ncbi:MAG: hypothetical protein EWM52_04705, partial [Methanosarcina mazei]